MKTTMALLVFLFHCALLLAQKPMPVSLPNTEAVSIQSKTLNGETYQLLVHFPDNYNASQAYDVLFVLDGLSAFPVAIDCLGILHGECGDKFSEPILVGISDGAMIGKAGNKRDRDFAPTVFKTSWGASGGGGAGKFLTFVEQEVVPLVENRYKTTQNRSLYGYSYGGLFASYALLTKPGLFKNILIGSPSLFADENVIQKKIEPAFAKSHKDLPLRVWLSVGEQEEYMIDDINDFAKTLQNRQYPGLVLNHTVLKGLNHLTGIHPAMLQAFKWAFCK